MTIIRKPITREFPPRRDGERPLLLTLHPSGLIELWEKRITRSYCIGVHGLFSRLILEHKGRISAFNQDQRGRKK